MFARHIYALATCLVLFPIFVLTIKGWISTLLLATSILSLYALWQHTKEEAKKGVRPSPSAHLLASVHAFKPHFWLVAALAMPILAIGLGQAFRHELILRDYDGPLRLALAIPILLALAKVEFPIRIGEFLLQFSVPATLFVTLLGSLIAPYEGWGKERLATYFVDPLSFGSMCLTMALVTLASLDLFGKDSWALRIWKILAVMAGIYLSIRSGSRTGWLGLPVVLLVLFAVRFSGRLGWVKKLFLFSASLVFLVLIYIFNPVVHDRIGLALNEISNYRWNAQNADISVGIRISFIRMAWFYFLENPLGGWGDQGFKHLLNAPEISVYASEVARQFAYTAGFHNEFATNMVRSGIWGLISSVAIFVAPMIFFIKYLRKGLDQQQALALAGLCYLLPTLVSGMTTEVLNLKFTASFFALFLVTIMGSILNLDTIQKRNP
jgi:O-antigen ligase